MEVLTLERGTVARWTDGRIVLDKAEKTTFERGKVARAKRDVLAERLGGKPGIKQPYALATSMIKKGVKLHDAKTAVKKEFGEQKRMKKEAERKNGKEAMCKECGEEMKEGTQHKCQHKSLTLVARRMIPRTWVKY